MAFARTCCPALVALALLGSPALSRTGEGHSTETVSNLQFVQRDNSAELTGYVTTDVLIDFRGDYTGSQMLLTLSTGSIFQHELGTSTPPNPFLVDLFPDLAFDTFLANGVAFAGQDPFLVGGAVSLGGKKASQMDASGIDITWARQLGVSVLDQSDFMTARVTLSDDAIGEVSYLASANAQVSKWFSFPILNGVIDRDAVICQDGSCGPDYPAQPDAHVDDSWVFTNVDMTSNGLNQNELKGLWFDLPATSGYRYETTDGVSQLRAIGLPPLANAPGDSGQYIVRHSQGSSLLNAGDTLVLGSPVTWIEVSNIGLIGDSLTFPTFLAFDQSVVSVAMTPIPEPATWILLIVCFLPSMWLRNDTRTP